MMHLARMREAIEVAREHGSGSVVFATCDAVAVVDRCLAAEAERDALKGEVERVLEDRARFPDKPESSTGNGEIAPEPAKVCGACEGRGTPCKSGCSHGCPPCPACHGSGTVAKEAKP